jgi:AcrR family transcriptional regulator
MGTATAKDQAICQKRGRPASASRPQVLRAATQQYIAGQRVDVTVVARELGISRATIYRWFGSREQLLGAVIAAELELLVARKRRQVRNRGATGLLEVFDQINRSLARSTALRRLLEEEPGIALRVLTGSGGIVQPLAVACIERLIVDEVEAGRYDPPADPATLAYAIVRLAEAFTYNDAAVGIRGDHARLREVEAALLGVPPRAARPRRAGRTGNDRGRG